MTATEPLRNILDDVAGYLVQDGSLLAPHLSSGKLLRGRLVLAVARIGQRQDDDLALHLAAQIELIHAGALIHDDIMDGSMRRRRRPTLWAEIGVRPAVFTGVALMAQAAGELAAAPADFRRHVADLIREVARGQTDELAHAFSTRVSPERYLRRAQAKTGTLYELAARLGGLGGNLDPCTTDAVSQFAALLGLGFQLADDVRDLLGGPALGRSPGTDLWVGVYTLPVLTTLAGRFRDGQRLRALLDKGDAASLDACVELLCANGAVEHTIERARTLVYEAIARLSAVPSLRARVVLEAYACELLGPLRTTREHLQAWHDEASRRAERTAVPPAPADPVGRVALHSTIPLRVGRVIRRLAGRGELRGAVGTAVALALLADEIDGFDPDEAFEAAAWTQRASLVGAVDLLLAELWGQLASLPGDVAAMIARRLAGMLMQHAHVGKGTTRERAFADDEPLRHLVDGIAAETAVGC